MQLKIANFSCQVTFFATLILLTSCSTLGPREGEGMLVGVVQFTNKSPQTRIDHIEFFGQHVFKGQKQPVKRLYGVWYDSKTNAFSVPIAFHKEMPSVILSSIDVFLEGASGEERLSIPLNLEIVTIEKSCLDLGNWEIDLELVSMSNMKIEANQQESARRKLFAHCYPTE